MNIHTLILGNLETNVYILEFENRLIVIDPAAEPERIMDCAKRLNKPITHVLLTHGHFDHCNAAYELQKSGAVILMSETDYRMIESGLDLAKFCDVIFNDFVPDEFIGEGTLNIDDISIQVIATPGHTAGSLTFVIDKNIFCGDTLFYLSIGRSDLPSGDGEELVRSVKKLYALDGAVYPGHGKSTTVEFEKVNNRYVKA